MALKNFSQNNNGANDNRILPGGVPINSCGFKGAPDDDYMYDTSVCYKYLINYNEKFKNERPILFRDDVIQQTLSCLIGK